MCPMKSEDKNQVKRIPSGDAVPVDNDFIKSRIFAVRGVQVMLDRDLAQLYEVEVGQLNRQVKRNLERFPDDFMFQLSHEECSRCQIGTLNGGRGSNIKYLPYAFTENGVAMLSGVLRSRRAIAANIQIMRAFVAMRKALASIAPLLARIDATDRRQIADQAKNDANQARNEERFKLIHRAEDMRYELRPRRAWSLRFSPFHRIACGAEHGGREVVLSVLPSADMTLLGELRGDSLCFGEYAILLP